MLYDPKDHYEPEETKQFFEDKKNIFERLLRFKEWKLLKPFLKHSNRSDNPEQSQDNGAAARPKSLFHYFFNL
jgi:succinate dehydrogenase flavin-adding protein (antitoxin of CptAB toxin-antitoxin module)